MITMGRKPKKRTSALAKRLTALRERLGLTQAEAAARIGVTVHSWLSWELGRANISKSRLMLIDLLEAEKI